MKAISGFYCIVFLACAAIPASAQNQYIYVRSNVNLPWGQVTNEAAMDSVFGAANWSTEFYETLNSTTLFTTATKVIFLEGGDSSFSAFSDFMTSNLVSLTAWVTNGGRVLIMSAPNDPLNSATVTLPDSIVLSADAYYGSAASSAYATDISHQIFSGPNPASYYFTGDFFSHGYFTGGKVNAIMQSNLNEVVLGRDELGAGLLVFGGMTTDNFQLPQPSAHSLLENILYYTAYTRL